MIRAYEVIVWCEINIRLDSCQVDYLEPVRRNDSSRAGDSPRNASTFVLYIAYL